MDGCAGLDSGTLLAADVAGWEKGTLLATGLLATSALRGDSAWLSGGTLRFCLDVASAFIPSGVSTGTCTC